VLGWTAEWREKLKKQRASGYGRGALRPLVLERRQTLRHVYIITGCFRTAATISDSCLHTAPASQLSLLSSHSSRRGPAPGDSGHCYFLPVHTGDSLVAAMGGCRHGSESRGREGAGRTLRLTGSSAVLLVPTLSPKLCGLCCRSYLAEIAISPLLTVLLYVLRLILQPPSLVHMTPA